MRSTRGLVITIAALGLIGLGAWYWISRRGLQAPPAVEVAEKWAQVLSWTGVEGALGRPVFTRGLDHKTRTPHVPALAQIDAPGSMPLIGTDALPADYLGQIDMLLAWGDQPHFEGTCADDGVGPLVLHDRLRAALAIAGPADVDRAQAVLAVARALRQRGSLIMTFVGLQATLGVARWAKARGVPAWPELRAAKPSPAGFVQAVAREAVCSDALIARSMVDDGAVPAVLRLRWQVHAYQSLAPLQVADPTFATLRPLIKTASDGGTVEGAMLEAIEVNRGAMLEKFEKAAVDFAALVGE